MPVQAFYPPLYNQYGQQVINVQGEIYNDYVFDPYFFGSVNQYLRFFRSYGVNVELLNSLINNTINNEDEDDYLELYLQGEELYDESEKARVYIEFSNRYELQTYYRRIRESRNPENTSFLYEFSIFTDLDQIGKIIQDTDKSFALSIGSFSIVGSLEGRIVGNENGDLPIEKMEFTLTEFVKEKPSSRDLQQINGGKTKRNKRKNKKTKGKKRTQKNNKK